MSNKKKKGIIEEDDFLSILKYNMKNTPGFDSFIKVLVFIIIAIVLIVFTRISNKKLYEEEEKEARTSTTTVESAQKSSYKTLVDKLLKKTGTAKVNINGVEYIFENIKYSDDTITGLFESSESTTKFKVTDTTVYEYKLGNEIENPTLFGDIKTDFVLTDKLVKILESNKTEKTVSDENVTYTYSLTLNDLVYEANVTIIDDSIVSINISGNNETYELTYD